MIYRMNLTKEIILEKLDVENPEKTHIIGQDQKELIN